MAKRKTIGVIGCGNMGEAIIAQSLKRKEYSFAIFEKDKLKEAFASRIYRIKTAENIADLVKKSDIIIIAVKPQDMDTVLDEVRAAIEKHKKIKILFISIAAGITTKYIQNRLGKIRIIRAMPNIPAQIGKGITALVKGRFAALKDMRTAEKIFKAVGETIIIDKEGLIDVVTALSGSGPAYLFFIFNAMLAVATVGLHLNKKSAEKFISRTISGSMKLLEENKFATKGLISRVTSKGGTTEAALKVFLDRNLNKIIFDAIIAAYDRAKELSRKE